MHLERNSYFAHSKDRMVQVQTTLVASPRNHLYGTSELIVNGPGNGAVFIRVLGQMDHAGDVADELDLKSGLGGPEQKNATHMQPSWLARNHMPYILLIW